MILELSETSIMVYNKNTVGFFNKFKPLYNDFVLTSKGVFRIKKLGYYKNNTCVYYSTVVLPKGWI